MIAELIASCYEGWSEQLRREFAENRANRTVGSRLLSRGDRVNVWEVCLGPGERLVAHRHYLDYFWTALTGGVGIQRASDGSTTRVTYEAGDTLHRAIAPGTVLLHDLTNVGSRPLRFLTVEHRRAQPMDPSTGGTR